MALLTLATPTQAGTAYAMTAAASGGDTFANSGREFVLVRNDHATDPRTVTFDAPGTCDFELAAHANHDLAVVVVAQTQEMIGPFSLTRFNDASGLVHVTYSDAAADLTIAVVAAASNA